METKEGGGVSVYNLTLESDNVYYANGILVENCLTFCIEEELTQDPYKADGAPAWLMQRVKPDRPTDYDPAWDDRSQNA